MARPVTLFTGQWADLSLETIAEKAASWGYDGLELACWGDHFNVQKALKEDGYCEGLRLHGMSCGSNDGAAQGGGVPRQSRQRAVVRRHGAWRRRLPEPGL